MRTSQIESRRTETTTRALWMALFDAGKVILDGPFADASGSMVILAAESVEAARAIFQEDPWAQRDILVAGDIKEWTIFLDANEKAQG